MQEIVLVSTDAWRIDVWSRGADGWRLSTTEDGGSASLSSTACQLVLDELYRDPLA